jgi:hypothetical protein
MWIVENWPIIVAFISGIVVCFLVAVKFSKEPTEAKIDMIKEWLLYAVTLAEKELGGGTGQIKLRYVWDMFIKTFPALAPLIPFDIFKTLVDEALEEMRHLLETIMDVLYYVDSSKDAK